jgi:pyruvate formate lyase activating enzyme
MSKKFFNRKISRREFLKRGLFFCALGAGLREIDALAATGQLSFKKEALYYKKLDANTVQCQLCPRQCILSDGQRSFCRAREPKDGKLYSMVYGLPCAVHVDPIEKKPLFHFLPGTPIYSIATAGCNYRCKFCQNWSISQSPPEETYNHSLSPQDIIDQTFKFNCPSIAYTYTEPSIFYEYMLDIAKLAKKHGLKNMYHSNGSLNQKPAEEIALYLDGADIDLKAFNQDFYSEICAGDLKTVLNTLKTLKQNRVWLEITNLIVPKLNDDLEEIKNMAGWIKENLGDDVPIHFSRFWPQYKLTTIYPTPLETLEKARQVSMDVGLKFVYIGNVGGHPAENTYCPSCKRVVIRRVGYSIIEVNLDKQGICRFCSFPIPGVWS